MAKKGTTMDPRDLEVDGSNSATTLLSHIETVISLMEEKDDITSRIADEKSAMKSMGFDPRVFNHVIKRAREDAGARAEREEVEELVEVYEQALETARTNRARTDKSRGTY